MDRRSRDRDHPGWYAEQSQRRRRWLFRIVVIAALGVVSTLTCECGCWIGLGQPAGIHRIVVIDSAGLPIEGAQIVNYRMVGSNKPEDVVRVGRMRDIGVPMVSGADGVIAAARPEGMGKNGGHYRMLFFVIPVPTRSWPQYRYTLAAPGYLPRTVSLWDLIPNDFGHDSGDMTVTLDGEQFTLPQLDAYVVLRRTPTHWLHETFAH